MRNQRKVKWHMKKNERKNSPTENKIVNNLMLENELLAFSFILFHIRRCCCHYAYCCRRFRLHFFLCSVLFLLLTIFISFLHLFCLAFSFRLFLFNELCRLCLRFICKIVLFTIRKKKRFLRFSGNWNAVDVDETSNCWSGLNFSFTCTK